MERNEKCFCNSGKKYKKCHSLISGESKLADMYRMNAKYTSACIQLGIENNCKEGCVECCKDFFFIDENEFLMILAELSHNNKNLSFYHNKAKEILAGIEDKYPELIEKLNEFMPAATMQENNSKFFNDMCNPKDLPYCMFLNEDKRCSIYEVRPNVCRGYGTTETCHIMNNRSILIPEQIDLYIKNCTVSNKLGKRIMKRPYPIFYWFSHFLEPLYYELTITKMNKLKMCTEDQYYEYTMSLH